MGVVSNVVIGASLQFPPVDRGIVYELEIIPAVSGRIDVWGWKEFSQC